MKQLTAKLIESGLIEKATITMLERWGQLEPGTSDLVKRRELTESTLRQLAEDIDEFLNDNEKIKETRFDINITEPPTNLFNPNNGTFSAVKDESGRYIVGPNVKAIPGDFIWAPQDDGKYPTLRVLDITPLYSGESVIAQQLTVENYDWKREENGLL